MIGIILSKVKVIFLPSHPSTMTPNFYANVLKIWPHLKYICLETKAKQTDNIPNNFKSKWWYLFPAHSDTNFLFKCIEKITQFQGKLSRNKEKQTDNIQMTLYFFSTKQLVPKLSKTNRQEPQCPYLTICLENKQKKNRLVKIRNPITISNLYANVLKIWPHLKSICPETKQNRQTIILMILNSIDDTSFPPTLTPIFNLNVLKIQPNFK